MRSGRIRAATPADAAAIAHLQTASWRAAYRDVLSDAYLDSDIDTERLLLWSECLNTPAPHQHVALAERNGRAVGFACAYGAYDARWGTLLENLHVADEAKRQGIGAGLMAHVAAWSLQAHPALGLYLWVIVSNAPARRFYQRLGAIDAGEDVWLPPDGGSVPKLRYVWPNPATLLQFGCGFEAQRPCQ
ncbi:MAG: GNAT family N-acetyltransferase [Sterolibacterium sp.]